MNCPACKMAMQKGYFIDRQKPVQLIPEGKKDPLFIGMRAEGAVVFGRGNLWSGYRAEAWYCPRCRIAIVPEK